MAWTTPRTWVAGETPTAAMFNVHVRDNFNAIGTWATYTPTWSASTAPSVGNGSLTGRYMQVGNTVMFRIFLDCGSTTTYGSGVWSFTLPVPSAHPSTLGGILGYAIANDSSASGGFFSGLAYYTGGNLALTTGAGTAGNRFQATSPMTWATSDTLAIVGQYEAS